MQQNRSQVTERDGLFELEAGSDVLDSPRYNHDMAPTKVRERTWNKWHITALWVACRCACRLTPSAAYLPRISA